MPTSRRGFASMTADRVREVASKGGRKTAKTHDMAMIGQAGGQITAKRGSTYFARIGRLGGRAGRRAGAVEPSARQAARRSPRSTSTARRASSPRRPS